MKISEVIKIIKPEYVFLKLKPNNSIRNNGTHKVSRAISGLYKNVFENMKREEEKLVRLFGKEFTIPTKVSFLQNIKVGYFVYMEKQKIEFYFIIPTSQLLFIKEKISDVWSNVTVEQVKEIPLFDHSSTKYQIQFKKEDGLSLAIDRRSNDLLTSNLNVVEMLEDGDRVGIFYNFIPSSQHGWKFQHKATIDKVKDGKPVERNKAGWSYLFKFSVSLIDSLINALAETLVDKKKIARIQDEPNLINLLASINGGKKVSDASNKKGSSIPLPTQIVVMSHSENKLRERNIARSTSVSFDTISEDNELIYKPFNKLFSYTDYSIGSERNIMGDEEVQNFIALAGRDILEKYNFIEHVETNETQVPEDLQSGVMCIGENTYRGKKQKAYLSNDIEFRNLLLLLIGPTRAGKSNLISHLSIDAIEAGECVIIFDFIENCELSDSISKLFPREKVLEIKCDDSGTMQGLGYNEVGKSNDTFKQYENAKRQTTNVLTLVNSINSDESRMSPKMERYLESASLIVFINNGSIKDVFNVLTSSKIREQYLKKVSKTQMDNLEEYLESLYELNETDKEGNVTGTKTNLIVGIIDRLNTLKRNTYMELMLKKDTSKNIDLSEEMQKNQLIVIKMPQSMFTVDSERDVYTLFWLSKLWLAAQVRAERIKDKSKRTKINLVIDELYQVTNTEKFLTTKLSQMAKFIVKPIVSCHYINQLKHMRDELRSANTSYMLLAGSDKKNFDELKNELYPFTDEDLKGMKRYYSMNYVKNKDGYSRFITALPDKVEKRIKKGSVKKDDTKN